jgi:hypothetical protein
MYVKRPDVDDLDQDVWAIAAKSPSKLAANDPKTLSWLIGIAKRCAPNYASKTRFVPIDKLLARESGDDLEGRAMSKTSKSYARRLGSEAGRGDSATELASHRVDGSLSAGSRGKLASWTLPYRYPSSSRGCSGMSIRRRSTLGETQRSSWSASCRAEAWMR